MSDEIEAFEKFKEEVFLKCDNYALGYEEVLFNSLLSENIPEEFQEKPHLYYIEQMMMPVNFSFFCKEILNIELLPCQALFLAEFWNRKFPIYVASRGFGKSYSLALYCVLRAVFMPGRKIVITGAAFRQSKVIFEYIEGIWNNAPRLRNMYSGVRNGPRRDVDMCRFFFGDSTITALPIGDGSKIRGQRANDIIADEFASISQDIFENVIAGFAAVSSNPIANVKTGGAVRAAKRRGMKIPIGAQDKSEMGNQIVISGTAYYDFNHFAAYWRRWKQFIESKGDPKKLAQFFPEDEEVPEDFNWKDYSIVRMPYELIPPDFMDAGQVARSRATIHSGIYQMEFGAVFSTDSNGFFKRSLIEQCTVDHDKSISFPSTNNEPIIFEAQLRGNPNKKYIYGVDPASEVDNLSIIILELWPDHSRIVYCWTIKKADFNERQKAGFTKETNFFGYCARKIRELMKVFPCEAISMDTQGGGYALMESLHDVDKLQDGEVPIWETIDPDKPKDTDTNPGLHVIDSVQFASAEWVTEANDGLRKDFEDTVLLFPFFDNITLGLVETLQKIKDKDGKEKVVPLYDNLEDCIMDIEQLKDELAMIVMTQTPAGRNKWDTPEVKLPGGKKGRLRKDRYSALLMANWSARTRSRAPEPFKLPDGGGFSQSFKKDDVNGPMYGPGSEWYSGSSKLWGVV